MKSRKTACVMIMLLVGGIFALHMNPDISIVCAEQAQYTYDSLGRVKTVTYQDGTKMTYIYDNNGNIRDIKKEKLTTEEPTTKPETTEQITTEKVTSEEGTTGPATTEKVTSEEGTTSQATMEKATSEEGTTSQATMEKATSEEGTTSQATTEEATSEQPTFHQPTSEKMLELINELDKTDNITIEKIDYLSEKSLNIEIQGYNQFKKKMPVIRSLKTVTKNGKLYLKIKIKRLQLKSGYKEHGYEIKYATNKKFKSAKTEKVTRNQKKNLTTKTWKVKKNKTYYVKVRAYMKTKKGKKIYSKYSVVKSITVNP